MISCKGLRVCQGKLRWYPAWYWRSTTWVWRVKKLKSPFDH